ncbi:hypothetical protein D3C86_1820330 [compost metagenome]
MPPVWFDAPLRQTLHLQTRFNREQPKTGRHVRVIAQFGRTHGGPPGTRGHDAAPIVGEEDRIDQFRLATGKLCDKCHHDFVTANLFLQALQPLLHRRIHEFVRRHPLGQTLELLGELAPPDAMLVELFVE